MEYQFKNVRAKGKSLNFNVTTDDYADALKKATNYIIKYLGLGKSEFSDQYTYLKSNIESGCTNVIVIKEPEQTELGLESAENGILSFKKLYNGILNERER